MKNNITNLYITTTPHQCASYQYIASQLQIHHCLPCFVILELDPVNTSPLSAGTMLGFVNRRRQSPVRHHRGRAFSFWFLCNSCSPGVAANNIWETQRCSASSELHWHPHWQLLGCQPWPASCGRAPAEALSDLLYGSIATSSVQSDFSQSQLGEPSPTSVPSLGTLSQPQTSSSCFPFALGVFQSCVLQGCFQLSQ